MFDEASDIQISKHLNMFLNVLLETGEVKTLTLALEGTLHLLIIIVSYHLLIIIVSYGGVHAYGISCDINLHFFSL
jgi:hypothetical protein